MATEEVKCPEASVEVEVPQSRSFNIRERFSSFKEVESKLKEYGLFNCGKEVLELFEQLKSV